MVVIEEVKEELGSKEKHTRQTKRRRGQDVATAAIQRLCQVALVKGYW